MPGKHAPAAERFWRHVHKTAGCWLWTASSNTKGYGQFKAVPGQSPVKASRFSWLLAFGAIPDGLLVCHHCDVPACVRPDHLFLGTVGINSFDMMRKGRHRVVVKGKLDPAAVAEIRSRHLRGGESNTRLARDFGVDQSSISRVINGRSWRDVPAT